MEVEFITLGDASERLVVPSPTLRNWTDQLEELGLHYVKRNNRNERVYYDNDIEIFRWIRDLKKEYGRKTTMKDLTNVMKDMTEQFDFRSEEEAPSPTHTPSNKTGELITPDDVQRLMENKRVRAFLGIMIAETTEQIKADLREEREILKLEIREEIQKEMAEGKDTFRKELNSFKESQSKRDEEQQEKLAKRQEALMNSLNEMQEKQLEKDKQEEEKMKKEREIKAKEEKEAKEELQEKQENKGFFKRLFGV